MGEEIMFGAWLKQRRKEQGIGPDALAEQIGCPTIALLKIESAERRPSRQMALVIYTQGEHEAAHAMLLESLAMGRSINDRREIADNLVALGGIAADMRSGVGEALRGARLLGASDGLMEQLGAMLFPEDRLIYKRGIEAACDQLGEEALRSALAEGRAMSMEEALAYALGGRRQNADGGKQW